MSQRDYIIAFARRSGTEERTVRLSDEAAKWLQRNFRDSMRLAYGGVSAEVRPVGTPPSPNLRAPGTPTPPSLTDGRRPPRRTDWGGVA